MKTRAASRPTGFPIEPLPRRACARPSDGVGVVRVIHGWGSSGRGGRLCDACRAFLERERQAGRVKAVLPGDGYSRMTVAARDLLARCPSLRTSERADALNPGITFVELR